jgi:hypothetical protein
MKPIMSAPRREPITITAIFQPARPPKDQNNINNLSFLLFPNLSPSYLILLAYFYLVPSVLYLPPGEKRKERKRKGKGKRYP